MLESKAESTPSAYQKLLDELPRTGPGTRGGEMLRRYWHPVCLSATQSVKPLYASLKTYYILKTVIK